MRALAEMMTGRQGQHLPEWRAARRDPSVMHRGDLLTGLPALAASPPPPGRPWSCITPPCLPTSRPRTGSGSPHRPGLPAAWLSSEGPAVLPGIPVSACQGAPFVLAPDGQTPLAFTDSHGTWPQWLPATTP